MVEELKLSVLSPEKKILDVMCSMVSLPGTQGAFTVLKNHRALLSSLASGKITYREQGEEKELQISSGFVEVKDNKITACVEL